MKMRLEYNTTIPRDAPIYHRKQRYFPSSTESARRNNQTDSSTPPTIPTSSPQTPPPPRPRPTEQPENFFKHYHNYLAVIFISFILIIMCCSAIWTTKKRMKKKQQLKNLDKSLRVKTTKQRPLSRQSSESNMSSCYQFSSTRRLNNNKHARLTSQRSWIDSPVVDPESPLYEDLMNKSLPSSFKPRARGCYGALGSIRNSPIMENASPMTLSDEGFNQSFSISFDSTNHSQGAAQIVDFPLSENDRRALMDSGESIDQTDSFTPPEVTSRNSPVNSPRIFTPIAFSERIFMTPIPTRSASNCDSLRTTVENSASGLPLRSDSEGRFVKSLPTSLKTDANNHQASLVDLPFKHL